MRGEGATKPIRVMHVEDHPDFRNLVKILLRRQSDIELVAQAGSLAEAHHYTMTLEFDAVVLDLGLPDGDGVDLIGELRRSNPGVGVLILSASLDAASHERAIEAGADETMDKLAPLNEVLAAVRRLGSA
jgi:DNA-binding NarL/FixJ family response regulator